MTIFKVLGLPTTLNFQKRSSLQQKSYECIELIRGKGFKQIALDFDETLICTHSDLLTIDFSKSEFSVTEEAIIQGLISDEIKQFLCDLAVNQVRCCIVSNNLVSTIQKILTLNNISFDSHFIFAKSDSKGSINKTQKINQLKQLVDCLYIDDNPNMDEIGELDYAFSLMRIEKNSLTLQSIIDFLTTQPPTKSKPTSPTGKQKAKSVPTLNLNASTLLGRRRSNTL